ncbi:efflux RND transporter periplasmic adaptor subunit, partial [Rhizobium brockwellii]
MAAIGVWQFGNLVTYASRIPYLSQFIKQPPGGDGGGHQAQADQGQANQGQDGGQHQGGVRRRGGGGPTVVKTVAAVKT